MAIYKSLGHFWLSWCLRASKAKNVLYDVNFVLNVFMFLELHEPFIRMSHRVEEEKERNRRVKTHAHRHFCAGN